MCGIETAAELRASFSGPNALESIDWKMAYLDLLEAIRAARELIIQEHKNATIISQSSEPEINCKLILL